MDCIHMAQHRHQWQTPVNTLMNCRAPQKVWEFLDQLSDYELLKTDFTPCSLVIYLVITVKRAVIAWSV
jgi:hypothetical protein